MTSAPGNRQRRVRGSGSTVTWNPDRKQFETKVTLPDGRRRSVRGNTERDVESKRATLLQAIDNGRPLTAETYTLGSLFDDWLPSVRLNVAKIGTYVNYELHVRVHLRPSLGKHSLKLFSRAQLMKYRDAQLAAGRSPRSVKMSIDVLRIALNYAIDAELIDRNVASRLKLKVPDNSRYGKALPYAQARAFLRAARIGRNGPLYAFLVLSATRLGEARALKWSAIDLPNRRFNVLATLQAPRLGSPHAWVLPKSGQARYNVPLVPDAIVALEEQQRRQTAERATAGDLWVDNDLVFANEIGEPLAERGVQDAYKLALRNAGIDPAAYRIHDLRHTANTYLYKTGTPMPVIMQIVGHTTLAMTARYAHVDDDMLEEARAKLADLWAQDA